MNIDKEIGEQREYIILIKQYYVATCCAMGLDHDYKKKIKSGDVIELDNGLVAYRIN